MYYIKFYTEPNRYNANAKRNFVFVVRKIGRVENIASSHQLPFIIGFLPGLRWAIIQWFYYQFLGHPNYKI